MADSWFEARYKQRLATKDFEATTKYRFDPKFETGGTFGVNYATVGARLMAFNYRSLASTEAERRDLVDRFVVPHYLAQFNEETIKTKQQTNCGEPCAAVCKKLRGEFKKDFEPYQTMGPLCGIFDQRAAERLNGKADASGFDAISLGGVLAWLMECLLEGELTQEELGVSRLPRWDAAGFDVVADSMHNAELGVELVDSILSRRGILDLSKGPRRFGRQVAREKGTKILDRLVYVASGRRGWMVPNQYWTPGVLAPMAMMGKYYMYYGPEFFPPRVLGRMCASRMMAELVIDDMGICRFHRGWAEEMLPEILGAVHGLKDQYLKAIAATASRINGQNASVFWESERDIDFVSSFLKRRRDVEGDADPELGRWVEAFDRDRHAAAIDWWYEMRKGIDESLRDFL